MSLEKQIFIENKFQSVFNDKVLRKFYLKKITLNISMLSKLFSLIKENLLFEEGRNVEGVFL